MWKITIEDVPCWYQLSWRAREKAIFLKIHQDFLNHAEVIPQNAPIIVGLMEEFKFADFAGGFRQDFGFNQAFKAKGIKDNFFEFGVEIPEIKKQTNQPCRQCEGSGKDHFCENEKCFLCQGSGKENEYDWQSTYAISASFSIISLVLERMEPESAKKEISSSLSQLMTISTSTQRGMHGGSLHGNFSISLCRWLESFSKHTDILEMIQAMKTAYSIMFGWNDFYKYSFGAYVADNNGWLNVSCPGDACGLHPSHSSVTKGQGYEFSCHNVDSPAQQITLLAGLAALHDKARKEMRI